MIRCCLPCLSYNIAIFIYDDNMCVILCVIVKKTTAIIFRR
jgi:hypothetical protein